MRCEICDRKPPRGSRGWVVAYLPGAAWFTWGPGASLGVAHGVDLRKLVGHTVFTCGDRVCRIQANRGGVPGKTYSCGIPEIDAWVDGNRQVFP